MKRLTALTLALSLCFTLVGCGGNPSSNAPASVDKSTCFLRDCFHRGNLRSEAGYAARQR